MFFSFPHIAVDSEGKIGAIARPNRPGASAACGALIKTMLDLKEQGIDAAVSSPGAHDPLEPEYSILKSRIARRIKYEKMDISNMSLVDITKVAERVITTVSNIWALSAALWWVHWYLVWCTQHDTFMLTGWPDWLFVCPGQTVSLCKTVESCCCYLTYLSCNLVYARTRIADVDTNICCTCFLPCVCLQDLEYLISKAVNPKQADYAVVTGVQVHNWASNLEDVRIPSMEFVAPARAYVVVNGEKIDLDLQQVPALSPRQLQLLAAQSMAVVENSKSLTTGEKN